MFSYKISFENKFVRQFVNGLKSALNELSEINHNFTRLVKVVPAPKVVPPTPDRRSINYRYYNIMMHVISHSQAG